MTRPLKRWSGLIFYRGTAPLSANGNDQKRAVVIARTKRDAVDLLKVQAWNTSAHYFNGYWAGGHPRDVLEFNEVGLWVNDSPLDYGRKHNYVQLVDEPTMLTERAKWAALKEEDARRVATYHMEWAARDAAIELGYEVKSELLSAALNMHVEFPKGAEEREDAYIRLHEAVKAYEQRLKAREGITHS